MIRGIMTRSSILIHLIEVIQLVLFVVTVRSNSAIKYYFLFLIIVKLIPNFVYIIEILIFNFISRLI
jgi:hypothetical protein